jgi:Tfp pilus assembly protein PilF
MRSGRAAVAITFLLALGFVSACDQSSGSVQQTPQQQANVLVNAGISAQNAGRTNEARNDYNRAILIDPTNKFAYFNLGVTYQQANDNTDAEKQYRVALTIDSSFVAALFNLAIIRTPVDAAEAETLYRQIIQVQSGYAAAHLNLGFLLVSEGKTKEGKAELAQAVSLDPSLASRTASPVTPTPTH